MRGWEDELAAVTDGYNHGTQSGLDLKGLVNMQMMSAISGALWCVFGITEVE